MRDLAAYEHASQAEIEAHHYAVERMIELMIGVASDLLFHLLSERDLHPTSYREAFKLAGEVGMLPPDLSTSLQQAAGMRNIIVHLYEELDYAIIHQSIALLLQDMAQFVALAEGWVPHDSR
ncbi:hypothetical protein CJ255_18195 [Candidatus Viridilinea mediisalina]|uniref:DUF86 domain-containing protein n=2 Tax=Candidatus Viridilinea mediisalina TaxID=2024553 RepID=A0A2A6REY4_9CHLR|nr:hypothetical protein CJ255_18195 [Candidatus Viridilinea mediisalina]